MTATAVLALLLCGCRGVPVTHYYVLEPRDVLGAAADGRAGIDVGVEAFQIDGPYDQDRIVYRAGAESAEIGYYAYHRWATPLSRMLPRVVSGALHGAAGIASIEPAAPRRAYGATLRGRLLALEEIDGPDGVRVGIGLTLTLVAADGTVLWSDTLSRRAPPQAAAGVAQVVTEMRSVLDALLTAARPDIEQGLRKQRQLP